MHQIDNEIFNICCAKIRVLKPAPAVNPFQDSTMGPFNTFGLSIITLEDEDGSRGEAPIYSSYVNILEKCFFPILFFSRNIPYSELYHRLYWSIRNEGFRGQASALLGQIDMALYDLAARRKGIPVHQYLYANRNYVEMYGSGGGTNYSFAELEKEIGFFLDAGIDCYKMKVGKEFGTKMEEDIMRVKFVRCLLGKDIKLSLDANQIWSVEQAIRFIDQVEGENIAWMEEPIHSAAYTEIEQLCKRTSIKISYGESERSSKTFPALVNAGVRHLQPIPTQMGSMKEWMEVRDLAKEYAVDFSSGGYTMYTSALMATTPESWRVEYLYSIMHGLEEYFSVYPQWSKGKLLLPETEGLPVRIDWDYCEKNNKITMTQRWARDEMRKYDPVVTM
jgi:L-alanine-DL-glutamate epimerase-like enolase superfamily enzyme